MTEEINKNILNVDGVQVNGIYLESNMTLKGKRKTASDDFVKDMLTNGTKELNSDDESRNLEANNVRLCDTDEQEQAFACIEELIQLEIKFDKQTSFTCIEELIKMEIDFDEENKTKYKQQIVRVLTRKRCRVENEEGNETGITYAVSKIAKGNESESLAGRHTIESSDRYTNKGNGELHSKGNGRAMQTLTHQPPGEDLEEISNSTNLSESTSSIASIKDECDFKKEQNKQKIKAKIVGGQVDEDYNFLIGLLPNLWLMNLKQKLQTRMNLTRVVMEALKCNDK